MKKLFAPFLALCTVWGLYPVANAAEYTYAEPVEPNLWKEPDFSTDHAYSIAFVGDPQFLNNSDVQFGEKKMDQLFGTIAETAEERKLKHVFVLGDITHVGYRNDSNLAARHYDVPKTGEWENAQKAILQLSDAGVSYSLCRGNHDDYMMDDYFNIPAYTDQFKDCGGFFSDSKAKYSTGREKNNPEKYVYWSATSGYHENSIVNSFKTMEICGNKYIFITVDFNPTMNVVHWLNETLETYSDHQAIITTHAYLGNAGKRLTENDGTMYDHGISATQLWDLSIKLHENVMMVVSGHVSTFGRPVVSTSRGIGGNMVREILVDHQFYDLNYDVTPTAGKQNSGMVLYMNFSEDGGTVTFDYYSTLLNKEYAKENFPLTLYKENPLKKAVEKEVVAEPVPVSSETATLSGQNGGAAAVVIASAVAVAGGLLAVDFVERKRKKI